MKFHKAYIQSDNIYMIVHRPPHIEVSFAEMRRALHEQPTESERAQEARQKEVPVIVFPCTTLLIV